MLPLIMIATPHSPRNATLSRREGEKERTFTFDLRPLTFYQETLIRLIRVIRVQLMGN